MTDERFQTYGTSHVVALVVCLVGIVAIVLLGRRAQGHGVSRPFAVAIVLITIPLQVAQLLPDEWNPRTSLPFQLCDFAWMFAVHALCTRSRLSATVTYLWGITLTTQAMVTPDLASDFPEPRYLMFWAMHILIVWAAFHLVFGLRLLPTWATYWTTVGITALWAGSMMVYNVVADTNYGYLNGKPASASVLDLLGPWPLYVVLEIALIIAVWALLVWPWSRRASHLQTPARELP